MRLAGKGFVEKLAATPWWRDFGSIAVLALIIFAVLPLSLDLFRLNLVGKYLTYAFVAVGLVLCWGYGGILSLGQGVFFGLGGYCMAMFLKLEASDPVSTKIQSTPGIPDFMDWNQLTALPAFWEPFKSFAFTLLAIPLVPGAMALVIGLAMFKRRVGGVYFAIMTQTLAAILSILIIGQQGYTGGVNGITDLKTLHGWDIRTDHAKYVLYYINGILLIGTVVLGRLVLNTKFGKLLLALRDKEERVRFSGYDVANFKIFVFCLAAMLSAIGGAMFAGRFHVAFVRRHRAFDRDGHLHRGRRSPLAGRRGVRQSVGELRQIVFFRNLPATLAVFHGRAVYRGGHVVSDRSRRSRRPVSGLARKAD